MYKVWILSKKEDVGMIVDTAVIEELKGCRACEDNRMES